MIAMTCTGFQKEQELIWRKGTVLAKNVSKFGGTGTILGFEENNTWVSLVLIKKGHFSLPNFEGNFQDWLKSHFAFPVTDKNGTLLPRFWK